MLLAWLQSDSFFSGRYRNKVMQVDSSKSGVEEEEMIRRLLAVENVDEPTEIVIHVNMLKEGWDVTNLYTIVPLRAANARTLVEQSIGRGLRLPYGKRTKVAAVDRLNIIAQDRFQEIIDDANRADSPIKLKTLILDAPDADEDRKLSVTVSSNLNVALGLGAPTDSGGTNTWGGVPAPAYGSSAVFTTERELQAAVVAMQVLAEYEVRTVDAPTHRRDRRSWRPICRLELRKRYVRDCLPHKRACSLERTQRRNWTCSRCAPHRGSRGPADHRYPAYCSGAQRGNHQRL